MSTHERFGTSGLQHRTSASEIATAAESLDATIALVLIGGCGGSGKSTIAELLRRSHGFSVIHLDDFARPNHPGWDEERFDTHVIVPLSTGRAARYQRYDWDGDRLSEWREISPQGIVVIDGVTAVTTGIRELQAMTVWVDAPREVRLMRGIQRDGESMRSMWTETWMPEEDRYALDVLPWRLADFVVDGTQPYE